VASQWRIRHKLMLALGLVLANLAILLGGSLWGLISNSATMQSIHHKVTDQNSAEIVRDYVVGPELLESQKQTARRTSPPPERTVIHDRAITRGL